MPDPIVVALSTCPNEQAARHIAERLVTERLATCVNRVGGIRSTYFWDGRLQDDEEVLLIIKTTAVKLAGLRDRMNELHPYELPELIALHVADGNEAYLDWVRMGVAADSSG